MRARAAGGASDPAISTSMCRAWISGQLHQNCRYGGVSSSAGKGEKTPRHLGGGKGPLLKCPNAGSGQRLVSHLKSVRKSAENYRSSCSSSLRQHVRPPIVGQHDWVALLAGVGPAQQQQTQYASRRESRAGARHPSPIARYREERGLTAPARPAAVVCHPPFPSRRPSPHWDPTRT